MLFVYGFPNQLTALQFEWAWQHPNLSRHLSRHRVGNVLDVPLDLKLSSHHLTAKLRVLALLLCREPYKHWPLKVHFLSPSAKHGLEKCIEKDHLTKALPLFQSANGQGDWSLAHTETTSLTAEGDVDRVYLGEGRWWESPPGWFFTRPRKTAKQANVAEEEEEVVGEKGTGGETRLRVMQKEAHATQHASIIDAFQHFLAGELDRTCLHCQATIACEAEVTSFHLCEGCQRVSHLTCLARDAAVLENAVLPQHSRCSACQKVTAWGEIVFALNTRTRWQMAQQGVTRKRRKRALPAEASASEEEVVLVASTNQPKTPPKRKRRSSPSDNSSDEVPLLTKKRTKPSGKKKKTNVSPVGEATICLSSDSSVQDLS